MAATTKGIDCAVPLTAEKAKKMSEAGMRFVCRYLVPASMAWKRLTRSEAEAITAAGMRIVSVFQRGTNDAAGGAVNGTRDGKAAFQEAKLIGQPEGTAIYFAVDFDAQPKDYAAIEAYLRAAAKELPGYYVGVYGSYSVIEEMARRGACSHFWQTYAWSKGRLSHAANIYQYKNGQELAGHQVDLNDGLGNEGWWDTTVQNVEKPVNNTIDKAAAEKVIGVLGALWTASSDKQVQAAAHFAANSLRDAAGIPRQ
ncbi:DUF1906 domain-containing protein [Brevibacillus borstelensis]|uniref:DUF1906 domain-containing protein n=1 Tax=Brevibacillus borstelensis TaxID=45462 RepID=UPI0030C3A673